MSRRLCVLCGIASAWAGGGCLSIGSSSTTQVNMPTIGRELIDLKESLDQGVITATEFEHQKMALVDERHTLHERLANLHDNEDGRLKLVGGTKTPE